MIIQNILDTFRVPKTSASGTGNYSTLLGSSSVAMLLRPLQEHVDRVRARIPSLDALVCGLTSMEKAIDDFAISVSNGISELDSDTEYEIPVDEAQVFVSGISQATSLAGGLNRCITMTSSAGFAYTIYVDGDIVYCVCGDQQLYPILYPSPSDPDTYIFRPIWLSSGSDVPESAGSLEVGNTVSDISSVSLMSKTNGESKGSTIDELATKLAYAYQASQGESIITRYRNVASVISGEDQSDSTLEECCDIIGDAVEEPDNPASSEIIGENFCEIAHSLAISNTLNSTIVDSVDALGSGSFNNWISNQVSWASDQPSAIKNFTKRLSTAFAQGGFKGVIYCLLGFIKSQASIVDDKGVLVFTDNSKYMPKEYIAGIVSQVFSGLAQVASIIVSIVQPVIGIITSMIGSLAWGILGSFKQDLSSTRSSLSVLNSDEDAVNMTAYAPFALFHGELSSWSEGGPFAWYVDYFTMTGRCAMLEVPGGAIFFGPGSFRDADNSILSTIRWEFHPLGVPLNYDIAGDYWYPWDHEESESVTGVYHYISHSKACWFLPYLGRPFIYDHWKEMLADPNMINIAMVNDPSTGVLSETDDVRLYGSVCFSTIIFLCWFDELVHPWNYDDVTNLYIGPWDGANAQSGDDNEDRVVFHTAYSFVHRSLNTNAVHWQELIKFANRSIKPNEDFENGFLMMGLFKHSYGQSGVTADSLSPFKPLADWYKFGMEFKEIPSYSNGNRICYGNPTPLPYNPIYALHIPTYNASTFWKWLALAAITTAAITTVAIIGAVKFAKWRKAKQLMTTGKLNDLRDTAMKANNGVRSEVDPETGEIVDKTFDTGTDEGKKFVRDSYSAYKRAVFKANLMSHIIGGTRYDVGSYYGDAAATDDPEAGKEQSARNLQALLYGETDEDASLDSLAGASSAPDFTQIVTLIRGPVE